jgi:hypothetical protein
VCHRVPDRRRKRVRRARNRAGHPVT